MLKNKVRREKEKRIKGAAFRERSNSERTLNVEELHRSSV